MQVIPNQVFSAYSVFPAFPIRMFLLIRPKTEQTLEPSRSKFCSYCNISSVLHILHIGIILFLIILYLQPFHYTLLSIFSI